MIKGQVRADGIVVAALHVELDKQPNVYLAEAKLVNSETGQTAATMRVNGWPPEVMLKLRELIETIERAIGQGMFTQMDDNSSKPGFNISREPSSGLGEFLGDDNVPPI